MRPLWTLYRSIPASSCIKSLRAVDEDDACWTRLPLLALLLMKMSCTFSGAPRAESGLCCASCGRPCDSPAHTPELPAATASVKGAQESLSVLFELKTHDYVLTYGELAHFEPQAELELLAARCVSDQPVVLVVLTDLVSAAILYYIEYSPDQQFFEVVERPATLDDMGAVIAEFLTSTAVPRSDYRPLENRNNPRETACLHFKKTKLTHDVGLY